MPVGYLSSWVVPSDIAARVVLNPKTKRQSGHPMEGRHASSSERTHSRVEDVDNQDIIAGGVRIRLWLMKVPGQLSPMITVASVASVTQ